MKKFEPVRLSKAYYISEILWKAIDLDKNEFEWNHIKIKATAIYVHSITFFRKNVHDVQ